MCQGAKAASLAAHHAGNALSKLFQTIKGATGSNPNVDMITDSVQATVHAAKTGAVQHCLSENYGKIKSATCKDEVMHNMRIRLKSFTMNDKIAKACEADRKKFCSETEGGKGRVMVCIREHYKLLSDGCKESTTEVVDKLKTLQLMHSSSGGGGGGSIRGATTAPGASSNISLSGPLAMAGVVSMGILVAGLVITLLGRLRRRSKGYSVVTIDKGG